MSTDPLFMKIGTEYYWYHNDHLGTPQMMTTSSGAVVWKAEYSSFGKATVDSASTVINPLRFPGQYEDAETGLHYNLLRYYDPGIGRYLRTDPIGFWGGINLYAYCIGNPANWGDPYGLAVAEMVLATAAFTEAAIVVGTGMVAALVGYGTYALTTAALKDTAIGRGDFGGWVYDKLHPTPAMEMGKGERRWGRRGGDDELWEKDIEELKRIEKSDPDPDRRKRAKKIRKMKQKSRRCPNN
jgi:RHS repeat-associated protein